MPLRPHRVCKFWWGDEPLERVQISDPIREQPMKWEEGKGSKQRLARERWRGRGREPVRPRRRVDHLVGVSEMPTEKKIDWSTFPE
jgi:hypothetical protein